MKISFRFIGIHSDDSAPNHSIDSFSFHFQRAILLGLKETGVLTQMQHRNAEAALCQQYNKISKTIGATYND